MMWIPLVWAEKFRELVDKNGCNSEQTCMDFLIYIQKTETEFNNSIRYDVL